MSEPLPRTLFEPHVGTTFDLQCEGQDPLPLQLTHVTERPGAVVEGFSLFFTGPEHVVANQAIHRLVHPVLGELEIFLGPIHDPHTSGITYQAVFNRLLSNP